MGRFVQADPTGFGGGDANLYRYVFNQPGNFVDPFGLSVRNNSNVPIAVIQEDDLNGTIILPPGRYYPGRQEGIFLATVGGSLANYYKTIDYVDVTYHASGYAESHAPNPFRAAAQMVAGGWMGNPFDISTNSVLADVQAQLNFDALKGMVKNICP